MSVTIEHGNSGTQTIYVSNMFPTNNFQIFDMIFEHSYIDFELGRSIDVFETQNNKITIANESVNIGIENCTFKNYESRAALYIADIECDTSKTVI